MCAVTVVKPNIPFGYPPEGLIIKESQFCDSFILYEHLFLTLFVYPAIIMTSEVTVPNVRGIPLIRSWEAAIFCSLGSRNTVRMKHSRPLGECGFSLEEVPR